MLYKSLKFNIEHENQPLGKEIPNLETIMFRFQPLNFGAIYCNLTLAFLHGIYPTKTSVFCLNFFQNLPLFNKVADLSLKNNFGNKPTQMIQ